MNTTAQYLYNYTESVTNNLKREAKKREARKELWVI